jgi:hypothetical protein
VADVKVGRIDSYNAPVAVVTIADKVVYATFVTSTPVRIFTPFDCSDLTNASTSDEYLQAPELVTPRRCTLCRI